MWSMIGKTSGWMLGIGAAVSLSGVLASDVNANEIRAGFNSAYDFDDMGPMDDPVYEGWDWAANEGRWDFYRNPANPDHAETVTSGGYEISFHGGRLPDAESNSQWDRRDDVENTTPIVDFVGTFNREEHEGPRWLTTEGVPEGYEVSVWVYTYNDWSDNARVFVDLNNDGAWDTDILGTGEGHIDVISESGMGPTELAPELGTGEGVFTGDSGGDHNGIVQLNFISDGNGFRIGWDAYPGQNVGGFSGMLLHAVPEPASAGLLAAGALLMLGRRGRHHTQM